MSSRNREALQHRSMARYWILAGSVSYIPHAMLLLFFSAPNKNWMWESLQRIRWTSNFERSYFGENAFENIGTKQTSRPNFVRIDNLQRKDKCNMDQIVTVIVTKYFISFQMKVIRKQRKNKGKWGEPAFYFPSCNWYTFTFGLQY